MNRAERERDIASEEHVLDAIAERLAARVSLADWPVELRDALALAVADDARSRTETWRASALRLHLFGPSGRAPADLIAPAHPAPRTWRHAEHLRDGLAYRTRLRSAVYL